MNHNGYNIYIPHIVSTADTEMKTGGREKKGGEGGAGKEVRNGYSSIFSALPVETHHRLCWI